MTPAMIGGTLIASALISGCAVPRSYTQHDMPAVGEHNICLRVTLTSTRDESRALCLAEFNADFLACGEYPRADGGPQRLIAPGPQTWNDWFGKVVLGHELLHNLGGKHED